MAKKIETLFREKCQKKLDALPKLYRETVQQIAKRGTPDNLLSVHGFFVGLEYKAPGEKPTKLQYHQLKKIRDSGGYSLVARPDNWDRVYAFLELFALQGFPSVCMKYRNELTPFDRGEET